MADLFYGLQAWKDLRRQALIRDRHHCTQCGAGVTKKGTSRVDHIVPRRQNPGLQLELSNLRTLCVPCDNARHSEKGRGGVEREQIGVDGLPDSWR